MTFAQILDMTMSRNLVYEQFNALHRRGWHNLTTDERAELEHLRDRLDTIDHTLSSASRV